MLTNLGQPSSDSDRKSPNAAKLAQHLAEGRPNLGASPFFSSKSAVLPAGAMARGAGHEGGSAWGRGGMCGMVVGRVGVWALLQKRSGRESEARLEPNRSAARLLLHVSLLSLFRLDITQIAARTPLGRRSAPLKRHSGAETADASEGQEPRLSERIPRRSHVHVSKVLRNAPELHSRRFGPWAVSRIRLKIGTTPETLRNVGSPRTDLAKLRPDGVARRGESRYPSPKPRRL